LRCIILMGGLQSASCRLVPCFQSASRRLGLSKQIITNFLTGGLQSASCRLVLCLQSASYRLGPSQKFKEKVYNKVPFYNLHCPGADWRSGHIHNSELSCASNVCAKWIQILNMRLRLNLLYLWISIYGLQNYSYLNHVAAEQYFQVCHYFNLG
jgi:hypothetical protein